MKTAASLNEPIAIIGMGCRFPGGADSPRSFWKLLADGADGIVEVPSERWNIDRFHDTDDQMPGKMYLRAGGFLRERIDRFDALFFGLSPREAALLDPQQRILLEVAWEALEDAGLVAEHLAGSDTGVYVGGLALDNMMTQLHPDNLHAVGVHTAVSTMMTMLSNRLSYTFDLRGPSMSIDTACSSSLVALHQACQAVWAGECRLALVGGVNIMHRPEYLIMLCKGGFVAHDGRCKSFDARADGYGRGEGAGVVVLKPYADALRDGDAIYALVRATGVNQDGRTDGITVPNPHSQEALMRRVLRQAQLTPDSIRYIEAHGTGTAVGDPLETAALGAAIGSGRAPGNPVTIGSVKANIGHLEAAAGIASLIKSALVIEQQQIPPVANLQTPNPKIPFDAWNLRLPRELEAMPVSDGPIFVGINSFGYGGTNAHAILQDAPVPELPPSIEHAPEQPYLLPLSARSSAALRALADAYVQQLAKSKETALHDLCYSASVRRSHHEFRAGVIAVSSEEMLLQLRKLAEEGAGRGIVSGTCPAKGQRPVFVFTGMGPQWWAMGRELYQQEAVFREAVDSCDAEFRKLSDWRMLDEFLADESASRVSVAHVAACTNFMLQVGLVMLWRSWGIEPAAVVGHSLGEIGAAWAAGALDLSAAIRVLYHRSRLLNRIAGQGTMMGVGISAEGIKPYLADEAGRVTIAAVNSPRSITLTGDAESLKRIAANLEKARVSGLFMQVEMAYHSPYMEPLKEDMFAALHDVRADELVCPIYSSVDGKRVTSEGLDADYWWRNMRQPVYFADAIGALIEDGHTLFVEVGPAPVLSTSIRQCFVHRGLQANLIASLKRGKSEGAALQEMVANLYVAGSPLNWSKLYPQGGRYVRLPTYPWQRETYWHESEKARAERIGAPAHALLGERTEAPEAVWESRLSNGLLPYLADHHVQGLRVLAGASYAELGLAIHAQLGGAGHNVLEDLEFHKALVIDAHDEPVLRTSYDMETREYVVHSSRRDRAEWQLHARGRLSFVTPKLAERTDLAAIQSRCEVQIEGAEHYQQMRERGLEYGPYFQGVRRLRRDAGGDEVLAWIEGHVDLSARPHGNRLHPTLFDSALQTLLTTLGAKGDTEVYIPVGIRQLVLHRSPMGGFWCHGRLRQRWEGYAEGDIALFDEDGQVLVEAIGVRAQALTRQDHDPLRHMEQWLYDYRWEPAVLADAKERNGRWLVIADRGEVGHRLAMALQGAGAQEVVQLNHESHESHDQDLEHAQPELSKGLDGIVFMRALDARDEDFGTPAAVQLVQLIQMLGRLETLPALAVVTCEAQRVSDEEVQPGVAQATLIGGVRVAINEYPALSVRAIDIDRGAATLATLADELLSASAEDEVALRGTQRYVHRMQRCRIQNLTRLGSVSATTAAGHVQNSEAQRDPAADEVQVAMYNARPDGAGGATGIGRVIKIGKSLQGFRQGDEALVYLRGRPEQRANVSSQAVFLLPERDHEVAAELPIFAAAQYALMHVSGLRAGESLLITAAASPLGLAAIQVARRLGARVIALADGPKQQSYLQEIGRIEVVSSETLGFVETVRERTGNVGADVVLNLLQGELAEKALALVAPFGRYVDLSGSSVRAQASDNRSVTAVDMAQLAAWRPAQFTQLLKEVREGFRSGAYKATLHHGVAAERADEVAQALQVSDRVGGVVMEFEQSPALDSLFDADASYLITGGFGGFGLAVAAWMVEQGAQHLVLVGRRGAATPEAQQAVEALREAGAQVLAVSADIANEADVARLFAQIWEQAPPLKGVFHTAAVLQDSPINRIEPQHVHTVMGPKAAGAWWLHRHTRNLPLDYFVLFSSVACMVGGPGQASYAMSCEYQDALARHRRALGLAATSINWGALAEVGMIARHGEVEKYFNLTGVGSFSPAQAVALLGKVLELNPPQIGVAKMDWKAWGGTYPTWAASPKYSDLAVGDEDEDAASGEHALLHALLQMSEEDRIKAVADVLTEVLAETLQLAPERIDRQQSLLNMGIDSLMAMELQMGVETRFSVKVSTLELMKGNNLMQLAQYITKSIADKSARKASKPAAAPVVAKRPDDAASLIAKLDDLGDADLDQLLAQLLPKDEVDA